LAEEGGQLEDEDPVTADGVEVVVAGGFRAVLPWFALAVSLAELSFHWTLENWSVRVALTFDLFTEKAA